MTRQVLVIRAESMEQQNPGDPQEDGLRNLIVSLRHLKCEMLLADPGEVFSWPTVG